MNESAALDGAAAMFLTTIYIIDPVSYMKIFNALSKTYFLSFPRQPAQY